MPESRPETTGGRRRHLARWRIRVAAGVALATLASTLAVVATPVAAQAATVPCPSAQTMAEDGLIWQSAYVYGVSVAAPPNSAPFTSVPVTEITSYAPTFLVSQQKVVQNASNQTVTATYTSTLSQTFTLTESLTIASGTNSTANGFAQTLTDTIGTTFAASFTTAVGVNATASVPPNTEVIGDYGVPAYNVTYQEVPLVALAPASNTNSLPAGTTCELAGTIQTGTATAPEPLDGWRINNPQHIS